MASAVSRHEKTRKCAIKTGFMPTLLILSSDTGEGHNSAAAALHSAAVAAGLNAVIRKPLEESGPVNRFLGNLYNHLLAWRPRTVRQYFWLLDRARPNERDFCYARARRYIGKFLDSERPDILLSLHPMLNHFVQRFIKEEALGIPCYTFLTDPFPPFWAGWASPYVDRYYRRSLAGTDGHGSVRGFHRERPNAGAPPLPRSHDE
jgi:hypothetical protein